MWYKNITGRFFGLVTKHACETDGQADRQNYDYKTALAQLRSAVKMTDESNEHENCTKK